MQKLKWKFVFNFANELERETDRERERKIMFKEIFVLLINETL